VLVDSNSNGDWLPSCFSVFGFDSCESQLPLLLGFGFHFFSFLSFHFLCGFKVGGLPSIDVISQAFPHLANLFLLYFLDTKKASPLRVRPFDLPHRLALLPINQAD